MHTMLTGGPVRISRPGISHPLSAAFRDSTMAAGVPYNDDMNGENREGVGPTDVTATGGLRYSAARSYLTPVRHRKNPHRTYGGTYVAYRLQR